MRLLFIFLFISGISYSQGKVMSRYNNGAKCVVIFYTGTGISEKISKKYHYDEYSAEIKAIETYSPKGHIAEIKWWSYDENGKKYLMYVDKSYDVVFMGYGKVKRTEYNNRGEIVGVNEYEGVLKF